VRLVGVAEVLGHAGEPRPERQGRGQPDPPAAMGGHDLRLADPHRAAAPGRHQHGTVAVRHDLARPGAEIAEPVPVGVVDVRRLAGQLRADPEGRRPNAPEDSVGRGVPAECQPVPPQAGR
jgi:hypothetical protein